ncbi:MAG: hypothetical protein N3A69_08220, partial [Leptospiraceae bacterium]|nr:hypothetical protein [Leptospiraceae bacterium]
MILLELTKTKARKLITTMKKFTSIILVFLLSCSSTEQVQETMNEKLPKKQEETKTNPLSLNKYDLKLVAPLQTSSEVTKMVEKRKKDFAWRYDFTNQSDFNNILYAADTPKNRDWLIKEVEDKTKKYGRRLLSLYKLVEWENIKKDYSKAAAWLDKYGKDFPAHKEDLAKFSALLKSKSENVEVVNLGNEVNASSSYLPIPELNEKKIYYTGFNPPSGSGGEDVLEVTFENGKWTNRKIIRELSTTSHDSPTGISADGTMMLIFGNYSTSFGGGDLFLSELKEKGWNPPLHLGHPINSKDFDSDGIFTPDGKAFLFVSDRDGGYYPKVAKGVYNAGHTWGNTDIYISFIQEDGTFGEPINLGPMINTPGAERQPFLHPDGKTLYFSSNGFNVNFGNLDVYKSVRLDDTWMNWSEPINIGKEINTVGADWGFKLAASGERAYISRYNSQSNSD